MAASTSVVTNPAATEDRLLQLLREELNGEEQQMFVQSFHMYLKYNAKKDFVIDLDDVYEWAGYTRKDSAKTSMLGIGLKENVEYKIVPLLRPKTEQKQQGGHNKDTIMMTVNGFKRFCLSAGTKKAKRVQGYFIAMEGIVMEYVQEQRMLAINTQAQLEQSLVQEREAATKAQEEATKAQEEATRLAAELEHFRTKFYVEVLKNDTVYINKERAMLTADDHKIGITINPTSRSSALNTGSAQGSVMIYTRKTHNAKIVESSMKLQLKRYNIGNGGGTEHYNNRVEHTIDLMDMNCLVQDTLASTYETMKRNDIYRKVIEKIREEMEPESSSIVTGVEGAQVKNADAHPTADDGVAPRMIATCDEFLDKYVDFDPIRTPESAGKKYFAYITDKDMFAKLWDWYENGKAAWKLVLQKAMENRDRPRVQIKPVKDGVQKEFWAYNRVAWK